MRRIAGCWRLLAGAGIGAATSVLILAYAPLPPAALVRVVSPADGAEVSGTVRLQATAQAPGVGMLQFLVSGSRVGPWIVSGACAFAWDTRLVPNGRQTIAVAWRDAREMVTSTSASIAVDVVNPPHTRAGIR